MPQSSGPRQDMVSVIASKVALSDLRSRSKDTQPVIPHMCYLPRPASGPSPLTCGLSQPIPANQFVFS
ncbi:hypothetical protein TNCT6_75300 [Streptomyces sp. 6-11-2]|nr:hypothetical protein TNCT6_75300 [Streptomyces sp. 6-11-2]